MPIATTIPSLLAAAALWCLGTVGAAPPHTPSIAANRASVAAETASQPQSGDELRRERARRRAEERQDREDALARGVDPNAGILRDAPPLPDDLLDRYTAHTETLASAQMEGREPGTPGMERTAAYIEDHLRTLGLRPAFNETDPQGSSQPTFRQSFDLEKSVALESATLASPALTSAPRLDEDFSVLSLSGTASAQGPLVFVGYSIVAGPRGYLGFEPDTDLDGKVALMLRYEPMDTKGRSRWVKGDWSLQSSISAKVSAASRRNAKAVIIVSPPEARDEYASKLETTADGKPEIEFEIPVIMVTQEIAEKLIAAGDTDGRTLRDLIDLANEEGTIIDLPGTQVSIDTKMERSAVTAENIGAILPGAGALADEYVVVGAHYDHIGRGHFASRSPDRAGEIHWGADDNASGTAAVMLAASMLESDEDFLAQRNRRSVLFLLFSAEEKGLLGSWHYVQHPIVSIDDHAAMLNMDMVGRLRDKGVELGSMESSERLASIVVREFDASGLRYFIDGSIGSGRSDHAPFDRSGVPNIFAFTGLHDEYHTADDTIETLNFAGGARIARTMAMIARGVCLERDPIRDDPAFVQSPDAPPEPRVRLGLVPQPDARGGLLVRRVFDDSSASDADLRSGERITAWNGEPVNTLEDLNKHLADATPGDVVTLTVVRVGEEREVEMTLRAPDD